MDPANSLPETESVRAFLIGANQGLIFKKATWHSLNCFPTNSEYADFVFITEKESEVELAKAAEEKDLKRTQILDYATELGVTFRLDVPYAY